MNRRWGDTWSARLNGTVSSYFSFFREKLRRANNKCETRRRFSGLKAIIDANYGVEDKKTILKDASSTLSVIAFPFLNKFWGRKLKMALVSKPQETISWHGTMHMNNCHDLAVALTRPCSTIRNMQWTFHHVELASEAIKTFIHFLITRQLVLFLAEAKENFFSFTSPIRKRFEKILTSKSLR